MPKKSFAIIQFLSAAVVLLVAAVAGIYIGSATVGIADRPNHPELLPNLTLIPGSPFPNSPLVDEDVVLTTSHRALGDNGGVVLFLDLGCPPCREMGERWQALVNEGKLSSRDIVIIAPTTPPDYLDAFYSQYGFTFPAYADTAQLFASEFGVEGYPVSVIVDDDGEIVHVSTKARDPIANEHISYLIRRRN